MWKVINWRKHSANPDYDEAQKEIEIRYPGIPEKSYKMERRRKRKRMREHFDSFISDSTLHGLHFCFDKKHMFRRVLWTLLLLSAFGYVSEKLYASVQEFFKYPMSTTTTIVYEKKMELPAISICNRNDFRVSIIKDTKLAKIFQNLSLSHTLQGEEYRDTIKSVNHRIEDMLLEASIQHIPFNYTEFTEYWDSTGTTKCYTYNAGKKAPPATVNKTGTKGAVEMVFNIEQYEYDSDNAGLRLILHGQDETPVKTAGILLSPGFQTFVTISKTKMKNLPHPYKTNCGKKKLKNVESYSQHLCWLDSLTNTVVKECGCIDSFMPGNYKVCDFTELQNCTWPVWAKFDNEQAYECPIPCEMYKFTADLSFSQFPSAIKAVQYSQMFNLTGTPVENRLFLRENLLKVTIFYGDLSYGFIEQIPSYDLKILLGDIGGQLGLFLGSSVLTYCEFFDYLLMIFYTKYFEVFLPR